MDAPVWLQVIVVLIFAWCLIVVGLLIVGRVVLARELALVLPNLVRLFSGLLRDRRVPLAPKVVLVLASLWIASPIDLIPEFIPILGPLDDAVVAALALRFVLRTTDRAVIREHWPGDPATLERILRAAAWGARTTPRTLP